jgi:hypothetical protein
MMLAPLDRLTEVFDAHRQPEVDLAAAFERLCDAGEASRALSNRCFHCGLVGLGDRASVLAHLAACKLNPLVAEAERARGIPPIVLAACKANPHGMLAVAELLDGAGPDDEQSIGEHCAALWRHARETFRFDEDTSVLVADHDSGRPHAAHAAARGVLAVERAARG